MERVVTMSFMLLGLIMIGGMVAAQPESKAEAPVMQMGAPPEMKQLAFMVGTWDVVMSMRMSPDEPWTESKAVNTNVMIIDGCALQSEFEAEMMGMQFKGFSTTTYNRVTGKWQTTWIDNIGAAVGLYEGDFKDGKFVVSGKDVMPDGKTMVSRITSYNITDTKYEWMQENSMDNGATWMTSMKGVYTKRQ